MIRRLLLSMILLPLLCGAAGAVSLPPVGQRVTATIELFGRTVPLPPGAWQVASTGYGRVTGSDPGPYGTIGGVLLIRPDSQSSEFLLLHTNLLPVRGGWGQPSECTDDKALFQSVGEPRNLQNACSFVLPLRRAQLLHSGLPAIASIADAARLDDMLPSWALVSGFRVSDRRDMLDIRYGIAPRRPEPGAWFADQPPTLPAYRSVVRELGDWAQAARKAAQASLRDPATQVAALPPVTLGMRDVARDAAQEQISALQLGLYKLATYRVPSTAFGLAVSTIAVGNIYFGAWITLWQSLTHSAVFLGNELAWEWPTATPVMRLVGTPASPPVPVARRAVPAADDDSLVQLAANSATLPAGTMPLRGRYPVDGKQVPLPAGRWTVLHSTANGGFTGTVLGRLDGHDLLGLVVIHSNIEQTPGILGPSAECGRGDIAFAVTRYDTPEDGFCVYGKRVMPMASDERALRDNRLWAEAAQKLADQGIGVPAHLLMVGARARTQRNFIDARYYFALGADDPDTALRAWADLVQEPMEQGVRGRLPGDAEPLPWPWEMAAVQAATVAQGRATLLDLRAAGIIPQAELERQLAVADAAMADREQQRLSLWGRSFLKVATYRVAAYLDGAAVQMFFTGSPVQGVAVATVHAVAKPLLAYGNEIYWAQSAHGKAPAALLTANFPEIGSDR
ncbi:MAG: hypothetical protein WDN25_18295 [Acetobacteraceae bacterium]